MKEAKEKIIHIPEALDQRLDIEISIRDLSEQKAVLESKIFRQLISDQRIEYLSINWRKLYQDYRKNRL